MKNCEPGYVDEDGYWFYNNKAWKNMTELETVKFLTCSGANSGSSLNSISPRLVSILPLANIPKTFEYHKSLLLNDNISNSFIRIK